MRKDYTLTFADNYLPYHSPRTCFKDFMCISIRYDEGAITEKDENGFGIRTTTPIIEIFIPLQIQVVGFSEIGIK